MYKNIQKKYPKVWKSLNSSLSFAKLFQSWKVPKSSYMLGHGGSKMYAKTDVRSKQKNIN